MIHFAHPWALLLLALPLLLAAAYRYGDRQRRQSLARWSSTPMVAPSRRIKRAMQVAALVALVLALARPAARTQSATQAPSPRGGDVVFLLDVSRSMLAGDIAPTRLARAKAVIGQFAAQAGGDRLALVAFAGSQAVACPLTLDHAFFREMLDLTSPDSVTRGGTRIGDAIRFAIERAFDDVRRDHRTLVLLSDGEDHDSDPSSAAVEAARSKVRLVTLGIAETAGALVPQSASDPTPFEYQGATVRSRLGDGTLREIASAGEGGAYIELRNQAIDARAVYARWIGGGGRSAPGPAEEGSTVWAVLLLAAVALLAVEPDVRERRVVAGLLIAALLLRPGAAMAQSVEEWFDKGTTAVNNKRYRDAITYFADLARWSPSVAEIRFNLAKTLYLDGAFGEAALSFEHAAGIATDHHLKALSKLGAGNSYFRDGTVGVSSRVYAVQHLHQAIDAYKAALAIEPDLFNAEVNLRVAERRLQEGMSGRQPSTGRRPPLPSAEQVLGETPRPRNAPAAVTKSAAEEKDW